jgi:uncharacterized protein (TIGR03083 family)
MQPYIAPSNLDFLSHLARDSARFMEVMQQAPLETQVPTCPDWNADDLLWHLAQVQWFWGTIVERGLTTHEDVEALKRDERPADREGLLAFFARVSRDLHQNLSAASPETLAWTWSNEQSVGFIRRRQAHEALIHRLDAELTAGVARTPMDSDLSADGVEEALRFMYARAPWGRFTPRPTQTVRVLSTDTANSWLLTLGQFTGTEEDGTTHDEPDLDVAESDTGEPAAATVVGAAADLDCWLWHRPTRDQVERSGDPSVLKRLNQTLTPGID